MTILNIEGQDKYSAGDGIQISPNKVISLLLQASPNLLKINGDGELYCDLQTATNPSVNTVFDVGITTGYVEPSGGWPEAGQILMCKTTTGVHFCILKGDDDKLYYTSDPRDSTSWSHILRDDDLDALMDTLKDYIDEQFEHLEGYVKITSCKGVRESNHYMVKNIYTDADQNGVTLSLYRRDLKGELPNDLISEITFPVADEYHAGIITAEVYNQIQSNTARILALEGVGGYIGVYPTIAERPTNISQLPAEVTDPKTKDYIKIASDVNFRGATSIYTITAINATTGAITWDNGYASVGTLNYRIYDTIAERDAELNTYDGLACFVVATGKKYTYTTNDGWTADVCDYDDLTDRPIVNITGSLDNLLGEDNKTTVYNNGDGTRIVVSRAGQTTTQVIERKDGYSTRTTSDEGQTRSAWTNVEFESGIKWDKVIISATEPVDKVVTTPWLDTRDESLNVWNGVRWIKIPNTIQKSQLPTASQSLLNVIYQYVGSTNANYTNGYFYKCVVDDPEADPVTYKWETVKTQSDDKVLNDLDDVVIENQTNGQVLTFDNTLQKWENKDLPEETNYYAGENVNITFEPEHDDYSAIQGPCEDGFHIPSLTEYTTLKDIMDGLNLTTGDDYRVKLHMPFTGYRSNNTTTSGQGANGCYWINNAATTGYARYFRLETSTAGTNRYYRAGAMSLRAFSNTYVEPDNTWTVVEGTLGSAGIFYNATLGLISITNGTDSFTIKDKNEGATTVYSDGDTLTEENMGKVFQWGNNYGFPSTGAISKTSSTLVNTSSYAPSTYRSDTYITGSYDWSDPENNNLWGETTGIVHVEDGKVISAKDTVIQVDKLPTATASELNKIYQYTGATTTTLTNGFFYKCVAGQTAGTYEWQNIDVQIAKTTLVDLEDTNITNPQDGDVIKYDATTQKYVNAPDAGGIQYTSTSPYKPKYHWVGTQAQYDALSQYYTEQENDTMYFTI